MDRIRSTATGARSLLLSLLLLAPLSGWASLPALEGAHDLLAETAEGSTVTLGRVVFTSDGSGGYTFSVDIDEAAFVDKFLSMRPFNCIDAPGKTYCHTPYPYENRQRIQADELTDLDYSLLFFHKVATEYHAALFNGLYFRFHIDGEQLVGEPNDVDLDILMAPPEDGEYRPIKPSDYSPTEVTDHWMRRLVIR